MFPSLLNGLQCNASGNTASKKHQSQNIRAHASALTSLPIDNDFPYLHPGQGDSKFATSSLVGTPTKCTKNTTFSSNIISKSKDDSSLKHGTGMYTTETPSTKPTNSSSENNIFSVDYDIPSCSNYVDAVTDIIASSSITTTSSENEHQFEDSNDEVNFELNELNMLFDQHSCLLVGCSLYGKQRCSYNICSRRLNYN